MVITQQDNREAFLRNAELHRECHYGRWVCYANGEFIGVGNSLREVSRLISEMELPLYVYDEFVDEKSLMPWTL